jgi:hypothetical protein
MLRSGGWRVTYRTRARKPYEPPELHQLGAWQELHEDIAMSGMSTRLTPRMQAMLELESVRNDVMQSAFSRPSWTDEACSFHAWMQADSKKEAHTS